MAEASAACDGVQRNLAIPVSCETEYVDGVPSMIAGFRNINEANEWLEPFAEHVGEPFCEAANRNGREARVYMTVGSGGERRGRRWSCELGKWGQWFELASEPPAVPAPSTLTDVVQACGNVQANRDLPITCTTQDADGVQAMVVGFREVGEAERYLQPILQQIGAPFCNTANRVGRPAQFVITVAETRARQFDCEQGRWGEWFELSPQPRLVPSVFQ